MSPMVLGYGPKPVCYLFRRAFGCATCPGMNIEGDYGKDGYALIRQMIPREVAQAFLWLLKRRKLPDGIVPAVPDGLDLGVLKRNVYELYSGDFPPMKTFLWGLTPVMQQVARRRIVPTYAYFRIYRDGDLCHVHRDREACEHSMSLTLAYSDGRPWPLELGREGAGGPQDIIAEDFGPELVSSLAMEVGDAVAYQGVDYRHGRTTPNPNRWSAHLFLHWVERDGQFRDQAFDQRPPAPVDFQFS